MQIEAIYFRGVRHIPASEYRPEPLTVIDGVLADGRLLAYSFSPDLAELVSELEPMTLCAVISEISETTYNGLNQKNRALYIETDGGAISGELPEELPEESEAWIEYVLGNFKRQLDEVAHTQLPEYGVQLT